MNIAIFAFEQIQDWINTPQNAYLGSNYGIDLKQYLHKPMSAFDGDEIIAKMRQDIPILQVFATNQINIYFKKKAFDELVFFIEIKEIGAREYSIKA